MDQKTIDTYNQIAEEYNDETTDFWERFPRTIIDKFIGSVSGKVLDIGSGSGRDGLIFKNRGLAVICLDASESMVKLSTQKGLSSIVGDFNSLPFPKESFDGIWAYTALLHIPKTGIDKPLDEISRVLKTDGVFGLGLIEGTTELYRESSGIGKPRWFSFYTKEEIVNLLNKHGFRENYFEQFKVGAKTYLNFISKKS
ncbi:MAG: class I SAM-dependent methyltransferase [Patescibacteria group bacterium]